MNGKIWLVGVGALVLFSGSQALARGPERHPEPNQGIVNAAAIVNLVKSVLQPTVVVSQPAVVQQPVVVSQPAVVQQPVMVSQPAVVVAPPVVVPPAPWYAPPRHHPAPPPPPRRHRR